MYEMMFIGMLSGIAAVAGETIWWQGNSPRWFKVATIAWLAIWLGPPLADIWIRGVMG